LWQELKLETNVEESQASWMVAAAGRFDNRDTAELKNMQFVFLSDSSQISVAF